MSKNRVAGSKAAQLQSHKLQARALHSNIKEDWELEIDRVEAAAASDAQHHEKRADLEARLDQLTEHKAHFVSSSSSRQMEKTAAVLGAMGVLVHMCGYDYLLREIETGELRLVRDKEKLLGLILLREQSLPVLISSNRGLVYVTLGESRRSSSAPTHELWALRHILRNGSPHLERLPDLAPLF
jgi:hypothetical protein